MRERRLLAVLGLVVLLAGLAVARRPSASPVRTIPLAATPFTMLLDGYTHRIFVARADSARLTDFVLEVRASGSGHLLRALTLPGSPVALATYDPPESHTSSAISDGHDPSTDHAPRWGVRRYPAIRPQSSMAPAGATRAAERRPSSSHTTPSSGGLCGAPSGPCHDIAMSGRSSYDSEARIPDPNTLGAVLVLSAGPTSGTLTILDAVSGAPRYSLSFFQPRALAVDARHGIALVGDALNATITVVDVATGRRLRTISTECCPTALGIDEQSGRAVVIDRVAFGLDGSASVVDPAHGTILGTFPMDLLSDALLIDQQHGLALINGGVPNGDNVSLLDIRHAGPARTLPVAAGPNTLALDPADGRAAVTNGAAGTLTLIDTKADRVLATLPEGPNPNLLAVTDGLLFVAGQQYGPALGEQNEGWLRVLAANGRPVAGGAIPTNPVAVVNDPRRGLVLLTGGGPAAPDGLPYGPGDVWILEGRTGSTRERVQVGVNPRQIVVDEEEGVAYVLNAGGEFSPPPTAPWLPGWLRCLLPAGAVQTASGSLSIVRLGESS